MRNICTMFVLWIVLSASISHAQQVLISSLSQNGKLTFSTTYTNAIHTIQWTPTLSGSNSTVWTNLYSVFVTNASVTVSVPMFFRVVAVTSTNAIVGTWKWFSGHTNTFFTDGSSRCVHPTGGVDSGSWQQAKGSLYALDWGTAYLDSLYMSANGTQLSGYNQQGAHVTGTKIH